MTTNGKKGWAVTRALVALGRFAVGLWALVYLQWRARRALERANPTAAKAAKAEADFADAVADARGPLTRVYCLINAQGQKLELAGAPKGTIALYPTYSKAMKHRRRGERVGAVLVPAAMIQSAAPGRGMRALPLAVMVLALALGACTGGPTGPEGPPDEPAARDTVVGVLAPRMLTHRAPADSTP